MSTPLMNEGAPGPLGGYLIADLSSGIAGAYCTRLLADGGATVIKVEPPEGDDLRRWTASGEMPPDGRDAPLFSYLAGGKQSVVFGPDAERAAADLDELLDHAHAVVWSPGPAAGWPAEWPAEWPPVWPIGGRRGRCCPPTRTWRWPR